MNPSAIESLPMTTAVGRVRGACSRNSSAYSMPAVRELGVEERSIVTLFHVQGCSVEEIGEIMDRPSGTIKSILYRARRKMKDGLLPLMNGDQNVEKHYAR